MKYKSYPTDPVRIALFVNCRKNVRGATGIPESHRSVAIQAQRGKIRNPKTLDWQGFSGCGTGQIAVGISLTYAYSIFPASSLTAITTAK